MHHQMLHTSISICFHTEKYIPLKFVIYGYAIVRLNNKQFLYEMNENLNKKPLLTVICLDRGVLHQMSMFKCQVFGFNQLHLLDSTTTSTTTTTT